jgi:hypothetical protein
MEVERVKAAAASEIAAVRAAAEAELQDANAAAAIAKEEATIAKAEMDAAKVSANPSDLYPCRTLR